MKKISIIITSIFALASMTSCSDIGFKKKRVSTPKAGYEDKLFKTGELNEINIEIKEDEWKKLLENAAEKKYYSCDITINGEKLSNVGIRAKGGSSLDDVKAMGDSDRYSFMLKFDKYTEGQNYNGLTKLSLNNNLGDATQMKDAITYDMCRYIGLAAPLCNYAKISLNNEYYGCYLTLEPVDSDFCKRNYGDTDGSLFKPFHNLSYTSDDENDYEGISEDKVVGDDDDSLKRVIKALKSVDSGKKIEKCVDVDAVMKYLAVQTMVVNFDSLTGRNEHNYFLYEDNGRISLIPWDYNLAWGGYIDFGDEEMFDEEALGGGDEDSEEFDESQWEAKWEEWYNSLSDEEKQKMQEAEEAAMKAMPSMVVNFPIDTPFSCELSERSFFMKLLENKEYKEKYHNYLSELASGYVKGGTFDKTAEAIMQEIGDITGTENNAFFTNEEFRDGVSVLCQVIQKRSDSILGQIDSSIPSTWEGQQSEPDKLINSDDIDILKMGGE
jgi:spore coat protein CotH